MEQRASATTKSQCYQHRVKGFHLRILLLLLLLAALPMLMAAAGTGLSIPRFTVAGGGGVTQSDGFTLIGSVGQPLRGVASSNDFSLHAAFWQSVNENSPDTTGSTIYLPQISK